VVGLRGLRDLLGEYPAGSWFLVDNAESALEMGRRFAHSKPDDEVRPYILIRTWERSRPHVDARPRSARGTSHGAHPRGHEPSCRINKPGVIVSCLWVLSARVLDADHYSCREPDELLIAAIAARGGP